MTLNTFYVRIWNQLRRISYVRKKYLLLLKKQLQNKRVICGYNQNDFGQTVITTGSPRKYNDDKITYVNQKSMSEYDYISKQMQSAKRRYNYKVSVVLNN